ncbi:hypothetical protein DYB36_012908, partial [Aphanomyces astaci]
MLAQHADVEAKVRAECRHVLAANNHSWDWKALGELKYTTAVIHETLRLFPTASMLATRVCVQDNDMPTLASVNQHAKPVFIPKVIHTLLQLHLQLNIPMPKRILRPLYHCVEMNKAIEFMLARKNPILAESAALMLRQVAHALTLLLRPIKAKLEASKRFDDTKLDILAAVSVVEDILHTGESFSSTRLTVLSLAIQIALISDDEPKDKKTITPSGEAEARKLVWKLHVLCDFQRKIRLATDCSFLYWSRELLTLFVQDMYSVPENANAIKVLKTAGHEENAVAYYVEAFASFVEEVVEDDLVVPLCMDIENDLRLHVHSVHLEHMETPNPINNADFKVLHYYMDLRPIRIWGKCVDLRDRVTHYLESTFYNLTTVALHDWK